MTRIIGIKELQTGTKNIRKEVEKGVSFIVIYRSKPVFEIKPISKSFEFADELESSGLYNDDFVERMKVAEKDVKEGKTKTYTPEEFLNSLHENN